MPQEPIHAAFPSSTRKTLRLLIRFFGSLKLAMILLGILILACIFGTFAEARLDTAVAQAYVYDAPWFIAWLLLLCVNLIAAVLVRWPLKPQHTGFAITHAGIVAILAGAIIGRIWGVEGMITLSKGDSPTDHLVINQKLLYVQAGKGGEGANCVLDTDLRPPTPARPVTLKLRDATVSAIGYAGELGARTVVSENNAEGSPAVHLVMRSAMVPKPVDQWLALNDEERGKIDLGPAVVRFMPGRDETRKGGSQTSGAGLCREMHFAFAQMPEMGVTRSLEGPPTGIHANYRFDPLKDTGDQNKGVLEIDAQGRKFTFPVAGILGKSTALQGTPWKVSALEFFADFRMEGKRPISISNKPNNPALIFEIAGAAPVVAANELPATTKQLPHGHPAVGQNDLPAEGPMDSNALTIFYKEGGELAYESKSKKNGVRRGRIEVGKEFETGWADWKLRVDRSLKHAVLREELEPWSGETLRATGLPGALVRVERNGKSATHWIPLDATVHFDVPGEPVHVSFGPRLHPLNFTVALEDFEVERNEGTQDPAGFKSHVRFTDPAGNTTAGREIWMNHPANFPDFPGVGLLGTAYKFSQASWNPNDLNQTTLQVLRDPGWSLKWLGSLMLCGGIFTMFYLKPYFRNQTRQP